MDDFDFPILINAFYLLAAVLIFLGLKRLGSPATAREGNRIAALGMLIAVVVTLLDREIVRFEIIVAGIVVGAAIGGVFARAIRMTAMPQLVALFNASEERARRSWRRRSTYGWRTATSICRSTCR